MFKGKPSQYSIIQKQYEDLDDNTSDSFSSKYDRLRLAVFQFLFMMGAEIMDFYMDNLQLFSAAFKWEISFKKLMYT